MAENKKFVQGNEACVEGALYAGLDFYAGYPITPSTEIAELLSYRLPQSGGKFIQMEDEIASILSSMFSAAALPPVFRPTAVRAMSTRPAGGPTVTTPSLP